MALEIWPNGQVADLRQRPGDIFEANNDKNALRVTRAAIESGMSLSAYLESLDPSDDWADEKDGARLDAFGRQLKYGAKLRTVSDPVTGIQANFIEDFEKHDARGLLHEFCARRWREARFGRPVNPAAGGIIQTGPNGRSVFTSADEGLGTIWRPIFEAARERTSQISAPITLASLVAVETGIDTNAYKSAYIADPTAEELRMFRVGETTEIPLTKITGGEREIRIYKYGRGFMLSYEAARRQRIDKLSFWVQRAAIQEEMDKVETGIDVLINGDGNGNAATVYNLTTLHPGTPTGTITPQAWIAFKGKFANDYALDVVFAREADWMDLQLMQMPNANPYFYQVAGQFGGIRNINMDIDNTVGLGKLDIIAADKIVGIDTRFALEHVYEIGAQIREAMRWANNQTTAVFMSEVEGFSVLDQKATRIINLAA
jgi:hypothetical protein